MNTPGDCREQNALNWLQQEFKFEVEARFAVQRLTELLPQEEKNKAQPRPRVLSSVYLADSSLSVVLLLLLLLASSLAKSD